MRVSEESINFQLIDRCRCCASDRLEEVLDLGDQPPANSLRLPDGPRIGTVPLLVVRCGSCATMQLSATVDPAELFSDYVWVTGTASATTAFSEVFCREVLSRWCASGEEPPGKPGLVVEVASNDGTFLKNFKQHGWEVIGVEPARNIARLAIDAGIPTRSEFFSADTAASLHRDFGAVDIVIARNVIPHVADIHAVLEGAARLLSRSGLLAIEFHYARSILEGLQYDSIYHEHLFYFSLETLGALCESHGLHAFDVFESPLSGGSLVLLLAQEKRTPSSQLEKHLVDESESNVNALWNWQAFGEAAKAHAEDLFRMVSELAEQGPVVGYGASARSSTLLNAAKISVEQVRAVIDRNKLKNGRLTPGSQIPIVSYEDGRALLGDARSLLLLAWNFESEIVTDIRGEGFQGEILVPLPAEPRVV